MKFCLLIESTCSRVGLVRAKGPHSALWLWSAATWSQRDASPCFFGSALSKAEVPGARLPNGVLQVPVPRVSCHLGCYAALDLWQYGRPCKNLRIPLPCLARSI